MLNLENILYIDLSYRYKFCNRSFSSLSYFLINLRSQLTGNGYMEIQTNIKKDADGLQTSSSVINCKSWTLYRVFFFNRILRNLSASLHCCSLFRFIYVHLEVTVLRYKSSEMVLRNDQRVSIHNVGDQLKSVEFGKGGGVEIFQVKAFQNPHAIQQLKISVRNLTHHRLAKCVRSVTVNYWRFNNNVCGYSNIHFKLQCCL